MKKRSSFLTRFPLLLVTASVLGGCGSSFDNNLTYSPPISAGATGTIEVQQTLNRSVTQFVTHLRFEGWGSGEKLYGPVTRAKTERVVLADVPTSVTTLRIGYLVGESQIGQIEVPVVFNSAGVAMVTDPNWTDAPVPLTTFLAQTLFSVDTRPLSVTSGDFNGDGHLDLATANNGGNNISILLGRGDGTFGPSSSMVSGVSPFGITAGDFNGDRNVDLVATNYGNPLIRGGLSFFAGRGDGTFLPAQHLDVGDGPTSVASGDFNRDGLVDLVCTNYREHTVSVLLGHRIHGFTALDPIPAGTHARAVSVGYIDGDDILDLAVANEGLPVQGSEEGDTSILLGRGDGTFETKPSVKAGTNPHNVQIQDFNGDGKADIAVANFVSNDVSVALGRGDGTFEPQTRYATPNTPLCISVGDFNLDGRPDLAVACFREGVVAVLPGKGNGTFEQPTVLEAGDGSFFVVHGDFNKDGRQDFAVANEGSSDVSVLLGAGQR